VAPLRTVDTLVDVGSRLSDVDATGVERSGGGADRITVDAATNQGMSTQRGAAADRREGYDGEGITADTEDAPVGAGRPGTVPPAVGAGVGNGPARVRATRAGAPGPPRGGPVPR
jgi:hypothetical protein